MLPSNVPSHINFGSSACGLIATKGTAPTPLQPKHVQVYLHLRPCRWILWRPGYFQSCSSSPREWNQQLPDPFQTMISVTAFPAQVSIPIWGDLLRFVPCAIVWHAKIIFFSHRDMAKSIIYVWHIYTTYRKSISVKLPDFLSWGKKYIVFWLCHTIAMLFEILRNYLFLFSNYKKKLYESWIKGI